MVVFFSLGPWSELESEPFLFFGGYIEVAFLAFWLRKGVGG